MKVSTIYQKSIKSPTDYSLLKKGSGNKKLGYKVTSKKWKGSRLYSLTLVERETCPRTCHHWDDCYGNNMPFAHRFDHTHPEFKEMLELQLEQLNDKHPEGFVVRLHVLGDFYDALYITSWQIWLYKYENLNVFGYTHHKSDSLLGGMINNVNRIYPDRFRVRFSDDWNTDFSAHTSTTEDTVRLLGNGIVCPEQVGQTANCTTCGYCWTSDNAVVFIEH